LRKRALGGLIGLVAVTGWSSAVPAASTADAELQDTGTLLLANPIGRPLACVPPEQCCKVCRKGKACGNTCIHAAYDCHKGRGCACNADDICD